MTVVQDVGTMSGERDATDETAQLVAILELMTGERPPHGDKALSQVTCPWPMGRSQLNELLLLLGYDRVTDWFFEALVLHGIEVPENETVEIVDSAVMGGAVQEMGPVEFRSLECLVRGIEWFAKCAILRWGNVKFAFKRLSRLLKEDFWESIEEFQPKDERLFAERHDAVMRLDAIEAADTYYLGYVIERELRGRLERDPDDAAARDEWEKRERVVGRGKWNQICYLTWDHMDVYVATSMRQRHEYLLVNRVIAELVRSEELASLKLRVFDPTQAYCTDRIDKGLSEALMLKRASCTLYLAQESDTLGKDSELAATLAQGKPVVVFVPRADEGYVGRYLEGLIEAYPEKNLAELIMEQLQVFAPELAWMRSSPVCSWIGGNSVIDETQARRLLLEAMNTRYDTRAGTLQRTHPLGLQVNLETGVANGVLVARTPVQCAQVIRGILMGTLGFSLESREVDGRRYLELKERTTESVFRVVTGDPMVTNSFWNFYLRG